MVFSSPIFLFVFLPAAVLLTLAVRWMAHGRTTGFENWMLALLSLLFFSFGQAYYLPLLLGSVVMNYLAGRALMTAKRPNSCRAVLTVAVIANLLLLGIFKYLSFLTWTVSELTNGSTRVLNLILPIGISFYTFQGMSYVIDVYRRPGEGCRSFSKVLLYISFFPQLIAGPIVKFHDISREIDDRRIASEDMAEGFYRFVLGLAKKVLIANALGKVADTAFYGMMDGVRDTGLAWLGALCYALQIYYDFSGYSDMAIGIGRIFGFHFLENFNFPYAASSIRDFWRRWHISLSAWFKEYLYIPLGGNRKGKARTALNRMIVFLCTGIWHGANWTFLLWGILHGLLSSAEGAGIIPVAKLQKKHWGKILCRIYTLLAVMLLFVLFRADSIGAAGRYLFTMFSFTAAPEGLLLLRQTVTPLTVVTLLLGLLFSQEWFKANARVNEKTGSGILALRYAVAILLLIASAARLAGSSYNPFIYFQF